MNPYLVILFNALENIAIAAGATIAAIHFDRPSILAWYLLILLNSYHISMKTSDKKPDDK